jgi:hypothetical protein
MAHGYIASVAQTFIVPIEPIHINHLLTDLLRVRALFREISHRGNTGRARFDIREFKFENQYPADVLTSAVVLAAAISKR